MYGDWIRWRAEFKADFMSTKEIKPLLMRETIVMGGINKKNQISILIRTRYHVPGDFELDLMVRYGIYLIEHLTEMVRKEGLDPKFVVIYDRRGSTS